MVECNDYLWANTEAFVFVRIRTTSDRWSNMIKKDNTHFCLKISTRKRMLHSNGTISSEVKCSELG